MNRSAPTSLRLSFAIFASLLVVAAGCGDGASGPRIPPSDVPAYAGPGPYAVGVTTLDLRDRQVEVWYPTSSASIAGRAKASYAAFEVLPPAIIDILPPDLNLVIGMDAYRDVAVSDAGPFPILTFSHGAGGFRHAYSGFLGRLASHGLVVASIDHLEWGLLEQVGLRPGDAEDRAAGDVVLETVSRLAAAGENPDSMLYGGVDASLVATSGHSAGGRAAFALPDRAEIRAMIGYATGTAQGVETEKPILLYVGSEDAGAARLEQTFDELSPIKRFVSIHEAGHNSFTDQCSIIHGGNNFLDDLVAAGFPIPENLLALAIDGCRPENLDPTTFWDVTTHFTIAHLRAAFGIDAGAVGLGEGISSAFPGVALDYRHAP